MNTTENIVISTNIGNIVTSFGWPEYSVFSITLLFSVFIGIFFGCFGSKQSTNEEYLTGNRQMSAFPVAMSLVCSTMSGITMLGYPAEVYLYGTQFMPIFIMFLPMTFILYYFYIPVFYTLNMTSAFEYFELRFNRKVRVTISLFTIAYTVLLQGFVVYAPSISIAQVTGINHRISVIAIFLVCIFYSSVGGLKAVLWTDVFQGTILLISLLAVVIRGFIIIGFDEVWDRLDKGNRIDFGIVDPDPRTRQTVWTILIGTFFLWMGYYGGKQENIQRYSTLPNIKVLKKALFLNWFLLSIIIFLIVMGGPLMFAYYYKCDPLKAGIVKTTEQIYSLFTMEIFGEYPGLPGLIVAGITSASLSTVSSALNSLSAIITEDYVKKWRPHYNEKQLGKISKLIALGTGIISFITVFIIEQFDNILPVALSIQGIMSGPVFGAFSLGMFIPWANSAGALVGFLASNILMLLLSICTAIGFINKSIPSQKLPLTTLGCHGNTTSSEELYQFYNNFDKNGWKNADTSGYNNLLSISFTWHSFLSFAFVLIFGIPTSLIYSRIYRNSYKIKRVEEMCFSPPLVWLYRKYYSNIGNYIILDDEKIFEKSNNNIFIIDSKMKLKDGKINLNEGKIDIIDEKFNINEENVILSDEKLNKI